MEEIYQLVGGLTSSTVTILMWVAIGLGVIFVGVLIFDHAKRRKQHYRYQTRRRALGRALTRPFRRARVFCEGLGELYRHRARSKQWAHRKHNRARK